MEHYARIIQAGQAPDQRVDALEAGLRRIAQEFFGDEPEDVKIRWTRQSKGFSSARLGAPHTRSLHRASTSHSRRATSLSKRSASPPSTK